MLFLIIFHQNLNPLVEDSAQVGAWSGEEFTAGVLPKPLLIWHCHLKLQLLLLQLMAVILLQRLDRN